MIRSNNKSASQRLTCCFGPCSHHMSGTFFSNRDGIRKLIIDLRNVIWQCKVFEFVTIRIVSVLYCTCNSVFVLYQLAAMHFLVYLNYIPMLVLTHINQSFLPDRMLRRQEIWQLLGTEILSFFAFPGGGGKYIHRQMTTVVNWLSAIRTDALVFAALHARTCSPLFQFRHSFSRRVFFHLWKRHVP